MLGTEVVWHPESQNGICVYTTNNDFYLLSTDWFTMSFANLGNKLLFYSCNNSCYQRSLTCINNKI